MLNKICQEFLKAEEKRFNCQLSPILQSPISSSKEFFAKYDVSELTEHYYDRPCPACEDCDPNAEKELEECIKCKEFRKWEFSHEQLTFNNWIDAYGPGLWDMNQYDVNKMAEGLIEEMMNRNGEFNDRTYFYFNEDRLHIFYLNRDRTHVDYWFIFKPKSE